MTGYIQTFYYSLTIRAGEPKPQPGSPTFIKHRRYIHIGVILAYLLYTLYEADWNVRRAGDFYADLGVPYDVDDKALQSRFRRLYVTSHIRNLVVKDAVTDAFTTGHFSTTQTKSPILPTVRLPSNTTSI